MTFFWIFATYCAVMLAMGVALTVRMWTNKNREEVQP